MVDSILMGAKWCPPCQRVKDFLDNNGIDYLYVDIDTEEGMALAQDWGVRSIPSMSIGGNLVSGDKEIIGAFSE
jgi:glutaredoxin